VAHLHCTTSPGAAKFPNYMGWWGNANAHIIKGVLDLQPPPNDPISPSLTLPSTQLGFLSAGKSAEFIKFS